MSEIFTPKYRRHKSNGLDRAFVEFNGKRTYVGRYGTPESRSRYHQLVAEWEAGGRRPPVHADDITVVELCVGYLRHAKGYYRKPDGTLTSEYENIRLAIRSLKAIYGSTPVADFGPRQLKAVRQRMIAGNGCRTYINRHIGRIKRIFKWGVSEGLVPASVYHALQAVPGLKRGRCEARESEPVRPVPQAHIDVVRPRISRQVRALIQLQLLTAARPGELVMLRPVDFIDTAGKVWTARLEEHKTAHHGRERLIYFGPQAQAVVAPFLAGRPIDAYLFSPAEAEADRREALHAARKTPMSCGNRPGSNRRRRADRKPGDHYTGNTYRRAIHRACAGAGVPRWGPHRLRHNAATAIRRRFGIEAAQLLLGHARADVTQIYAEVNHAKALEVAAKVG